MEPRLAESPLLLEEFLAWHGEDLDDGWRANLTEKEALALAEAGRAATRKDLLPARVTPTDIVWPALAARQADLHDALFFGRGFFGLRRLPVERLTEREAALIFAGMAAQFGRTVPCPGTGEILVRLDGTKGSRTKFTFEHGVEDIAAYLCMTASRTGGEMRLVSAIALHNDMVRQRPDLIHALYTPAHPGTASRPLFSVHDRQLKVCLDAQDASALAGRSESMVACAVRREALAWLAARANEHALDIEFEPGDLLFINKRHVLVAHADHEDYWELGKARSILKLSLAAGQSPSLAPERQRNAANEDAQAAA